MSQNPSQKPRKMTAPLFALLALLALPLVAQQGTPPAKAPQRKSLVPDTFTNLQVLPKDIRKGDLVEIMRNFCFTMDKRCSYCHVATDDLSEAEFASDEKEPKKKARELLRLILAAQKSAAKPQGGQQ